jgi:uroporphyrinogen-III synthase
MQHDLLVACVGPVCAQPLAQVGIPSLVPDRARLGALVRLLADALPARAQRVPVRGRPVELRGHGIVRDGRLLALAPGPLAVLRALAREPGRVLSRADLLHALPGENGDEHAVEMTVSRLRRALGDAAAVQTVTKRGYRLVGEAATGSG